MLQDFLLGMRMSVPALIASAPFGLLVGAMAVEHGLTVGEAVMMSAALFAGASQLVGIELFSHGVPKWMVVVSIIAVNFRMVLYSAGMTPYVHRWSLAQKAVAFHLLTDVQYAETSRRGDQGHPVNFAWYMGLGTSFIATWVLESWIGATFGKLIQNPQALGIDFLVPIYFFGIVMGFRKRPLWVPVVLASAVASILAYRTIGSPWHITLGAFAGIAMSVILSHRRRKGTRDAV